MARRLVRIFSFALVSLLTAAPIASRAEAIERETFVRVLQHHVAQVPELQSLWRSVGAHDGVYLSGGVLRGLMQFVHNEITQNGQRKALNARTPGVNELLLQEWSDLDLSAPDHLVPWMKKKMPGWDVLKESFMRDSAEAGGSTLEKVQVNPWNILDPHDGLADFLQGQHHFIYVTHPNVGQVVGNSHLALALRFLRMAHNFPQAQINATSQRTLFKIAGSEEKNLRRANDTDYWVIKGLRKLFHSVHRSPLRLVESLQKFALLKVLAKYQYSLHAEERLPHYFNFFNEIARPHLEDWALLDLLHAAMVLGRNPEERKLFVSSLLPHFSDHRFLIEDFIRKAGHDNAAAPAAGQLVEVRIGNQVLGQVAPLPRGQGGPLRPGEIEIPVGNACIRLLVNVRIGNGN